MADFDIKKIIKALDQTRDNRALTSTQTPTSQNLNVAKYILTNSQVDWNSVLKQKDIAYNRDSSGPSVVARIFDILSRPNYAVANLFKESFRPTGSMTLEEANKSSPLNSLWEGFSGKKKTTFSDVIEQLYNRKPEITGESVVNPVAKYGGGFLLDVALDPLSLVSGGALRGALRKAGAAPRAEKTEQIPSAFQKISINQIAKDISPVTPLQADNVTPNLVYKTEQLPLNQKSLLPNFLPLGGDPTKIPSKATNVDIPFIKTSSEYETQISNIDKSAKNNARRRFKSEEVKDYIAKNPDSTKEQREAFKKHLTLWMTDHFPTSRTAKYQKVSEGVIPPVIGKPPVSENVMKPATTILDDIQKGDSSTIAGAQFDEAHRNAVIKSLGTIGDSERARAIAIVDKFEKDILSKPNQFATSSKVPSTGNPAQQANLAARINNFVRQVSKKAPGRFDTLRMIRAAEDHLISKGYSPTFWDGSNIRLSDVVIELATGVEDIPNVMKNHLTQVITAFRDGDPLKIKDPNIQQAIEKLRAKNAVVNAPKVAHVINEASKTAPIADQVLSSPKYKEFIEGLKKEAEVSLHAANSSKSALSAARAGIDAILQANSSAPLRATQGKRIHIQSYVQNGSRVPWKPVEAAQTKGIEDELGFQYSKVSKIIGEGNRAVDGFMSRIATWWGQKDLRPEVLAKTATASSNAAARARIWNKIAKTHSPEEMLEGMKVAQSKIPMGASTDKVNKVAGVIEKAIQNLFDSTGLSQEAVRGSTVAMRSGMTMEDLNKQLKSVQSSFKFHASKGVDNQGVHYDYSNGSDWLKSWEQADVKDPLDFMWKLETAVEQLMHKYAFMDEVVARWGSTTRTKEFSTPVSPSATGKSKSIDMSRFNGVFFPKDLAPQITKAIDTWEHIYNPKSDLVRLFDKVTRAWKSGVTIYAPSHHIRNLIGDVYLSWVAGVSSPMSYTKAGRVLHSQKKRYRDLESVEQLVGSTALKDALTKPGDVITHTGTGKPLTAEQIYIAAHSNGILPYANVIEELFGEPLFKGRLGQPFKGRVSNAARSVSENREHFVRLAHFINYIEKSKEKDLKRLFSNASKEVRKWHPDGSDLTDFERNVIRRILPFYSWTRKAIPLMVESALMNPAKTVAPDKLAQAIQGMLGIEAPSRTEPFPYNQLFPDWIKEKGIGPIARHGMEGPAGWIADFSRSVPGFTGEPSGYTVVNPSNPFIDTVAQFGGMGTPRAPLQGIGQLLHPALKIPAEAIHGETFNDVPIEPGRYAAENVPILAMLSRISNVGLGGVTNRGEKEGVGNLEALINLLTALGIQGTGPYIKTAEFQELERRRAK